MVPLTFVVCLMLLAIVIALMSITKAIKQLSDTIENTAGTKTD